MLTGIRLTEGGIVAEVGAGDLRLEPSKRKSAITEALMTHW
jgi:hypothetical protein